MSEELDPFECRLAFSEILDKVNASQHSIHKAVVYAMRHRKLSEDLYSCIIEQIEKASLNVRLNIIYVLDGILGASQKSKFAGYFDLTRPDLSHIVYTVVAHEPKGVLNVANTQKLINSWKQKHYFDVKDLEEAEKPLIERAQSVNLEQTNTAPPSFSKDDMLRRIEEDRERHKRLREEIWIRSPEESTDAEFEEFWASTDALNPETDYEPMMIQNMLRLPQYSWHIMLSQRPSLS